jgi:hypothetical protein
MSGLVTIDEIDAFAAASNIGADEIAVPLREAVKELHEIEDIEDFLRSIFRDLAATPHGPAEIVDILTHKTEVKGHRGLAAFVLKGRSFRTVRPAPRADTCSNVPQLRLPMSASVSPRTDLQARSL